MKRVALLVVYVALLIPLSALFTFPAQVSADSHPETTVIQAAANQTSISSITANVINAPAGTASIIMPDYSFALGSVSHTSAHKCGSIIGAAVSDIYAANHLFGALSNPQNEVLDTNSAFVSQSTCGQPLTGTKPIVAIAGPVVNEVVSYYESTISPLYFGGASDCIMRRDINTQVDCTHASGKSDVFLIESFLDQNGAPVYILYGRSWPGTLAAVTYLVDFISKNPSQYSGAWYVIKWADATSGASANSIPDSGDTFTEIEDPPPTTTLSATAASAWQYFNLGNGINSKNMLPRAMMTWNAFTFWDFGMAIDGTVGGHKNGFITQTNYQSRIDALLGFLETMKLVNDPSHTDNGMPYGTYNWDGTSGSRVCEYSWKNCNLADPGRLLNALGYLRRQDSSYATRIDNIILGTRLNPWFNQVCSISWGDGVYARDVALGCTYFRYLNSTYDKTSLLNSFHTTWTSSSNRITDAYGNSMPSLCGGVNMGPIAYELLENGLDYANTVSYASDMKSWAAKRYQATGKYGLWGSEFNIQLSDGSSQFAWEFYVVSVPNVGFKTWQVKLMDGTWMNENDPRLLSTVSSLDAAYALKATFPNDTWINSIFPAFQQNGLQATSGMYGAISETTGKPEAFINIPQNTVVLLSNTMPT